MRDEVVHDVQAYGFAASLNLRRSCEDEDVLTEHATRLGRSAKMVVWEHASHLAREHYAGACCAVGMTTHEGEVTATHEWDDPAALRQVRPSLRGSYERLFHDTGRPAFAISLEHPDVTAVLAGPRPERAIGVIYRPETERMSHYFSARLPEPFEVVVHVDRTHALEPLERWGRHEIDLPETYPTGV